MLMLRSTGASGMCCHLHQQQVIYNIVYTLTFVHIMFVLHRIITLGTSSCLYASI